MISIINKIWETLLPKSLIYLDTGWQKMEPRGSEVIIFPG